MLDDMKSPDRVAGLEAEVARLERKIAFMRFRWHRVMIPSLMRAGLDEEEAAEFAEMRVAEALAEWERDDRP